MWHQLSASPLWRSDPPSPASRKHSLSYSHIEQPQNSSVGLITQQVKFEAEIGNQKAILTNRTVSVCQALPFFLRFASPGSSRNDRPSLGNDRHISIKAHQRAPRTTSQPTQNRWSLGSPHVVDECLGIDHLWTQLIDSCHTEQCHAQSYLFGQDCTGSISKCFNVP